MRLPGPIKEGQGEAQRIVAPGAMLIFMAGQSPIFGKQLLYFQDPVLEKRSAITPPQTLFTIEHDGNILSAGRLYLTETSKSTVWVISSYNRFSFDSRYFGPVPLDEKVKYAKLLWLF
jgi:hypothetical protein